MKAWHRLLYSTDFHYWLSDLGNDNRFIFETISCLPRGYPLETKSQNLCFIFHCKLFSSIWIAFSWSLSDLQSSTFSNGFRLQLMSESLFIKRLHAGPKPNFTINKSADSVYFSVQSTKRQNWLLWEALRLFDTDFKARTNVELEIQSQ